MKMRKKGERKRKEDTRDVLTTDDKWFRREERGRDSKARKR